MDATKQIQRHELHPVGECTHINLVLTDIMQAVKEGELNFDKYYHENPIFDHSTRIGIKIHEFLPISIMIGARNQPLHKNQAKAEAC